MGVGGGVDAVQIGDFNDGGDFVVAQLLSAQSGALAHHAAGGHEFQKVRAVLQVEAGGLAGGIRAVHNGMVLGGIIDAGGVMRVRMAAGRADGIAADKHPGTHKIPSVDSVSDGHAGEGLSAAVPQGGEAGVEIGLNVFQRVKGQIAYGGLQQALAFVALAVHAAVDMEVDQAGGDEFIGEINDLHIGLLGEFAEVRHIHNGLVLHDDNLILQNFAVLRIKKLAAFDCRFHDTHPPYNVSPKGSFGDFFRGTERFKANGSASFCRVSKNLVRPLYHSAAKKKSGKEIKSQIKIHDIKRPNSLPGRFLGT